MGRFMTQLFGSKKEPWVTGGADNVEQTEISVDHGDNEHSDPDNEKPVDERSRRVQRRVDHAAGGGRRVEEAERRLILLTLEQWVPAVPAWRDG